MGVYQVWECIKCGSVLGRKSIWGVRFLGPSGLDGNNEALL